MGFQLGLARFLYRLGDFFQSLPVVVLPPDGLVELSRQSYAQPHALQSWVNAEFVDSGLTGEEHDLLSELPGKSGDLLLLGVGGGREVVPLARMGFRVTGVDYVPEMVARAVQNAADRGVSIDGLVQDFSQIDVEPGKYDVVWLSSGAYSCVPTRARRVGMVHRIERALKPGGYFLFQFQKGQVYRLSGRGRFLRRLIATFTFGNQSFEEGDMLWKTTEFLHVFSSEDQVRSEVEQGGLRLVNFQMDRNPVRCGAVCVKALSSD